MTQMGDNEGLTHPTGAAEQLKAGFASFDTTAFLAAQYKKREEKGKGLNNPLDDIVVVLLMHWIDTYMQPHT
jgi:hypothetical protein